MSARELDAAGITDPVLRDAYHSCRRLNARHGRTYFLATRLLPVEHRPAVHALYGFARWADDIVDDLGGTATSPERARALDELEHRLRSGPPAATGPPVIRALADTAARYRIDQQLFTDFLASMRMDLRITDYPSYPDLCGYMYGSAAVIGLQMLPVLGTVVPAEQAVPHAAALGVAFQLTNFLRDVGEDLDRGRVYLPADLLAAHGVDRDLLRWCRDRGHTPERVRGALREMEARTRDVYRQAFKGIPMLDPVARPCIKTAYTLYSGILDRIAAEDHTVLHRRAVVPRRLRATVAARGLCATALARARRRAAATACYPPRRSAPR